MKAVTRIKSWLHLMSMTLHFFFLFIDINKVFKKVTQLSPFHLRWWHAISMVNFHVNIFNLVTNLNLFYCLRQWVSFVALTGDMVNKLRTLRNAQSVQNIVLAYISCITHLTTTIQRAANFNTLLVFLTNNT